MTEQPQHMVALDKANETRFARAAIRAEIKDIKDPIASRHHLADLIDQDTIPACLSSLMLEDFLMWGYRLYPSRRLGCYELSDASPHRGLGALSPRQRRIIGNALRMPAVELEEARKLHAWQRRREARAAA